MSTMKDNKRKKRKSKSTGLMMHEIPSSSSEEEDEEAEEVEGSIDQGNEGVEHAGFLSNDEEEVEEEEEGKVDSRKSQSKKRRKKKSPVIPKVPLPSEDDYSATEEEEEEEEEEGEEEQRRPKGKKRGETERERLNKLTALLSKDYDANKKTGKRRSRNQISRQPNASKVSSKSSKQRSIPSESGSLFSLGSMADFDSQSMVSVGRNNELFETLWKGIAQLQHESGDHLTALQAKSKQLDKAQREIESLMEQNEEVREREVRMIRQVQRLQEELSNERQSNSKLEDELNSHKGTASKMMRELEESRKAALKSLKETQERERTLREGFETQSKQLIDKELQVERLQKRLEKKTEALEKVDPTAADERDRLREKVAFLQTQISRISEEREDVDRHVSKLSEENWKLKDEVELFKRQTSTFKERSADLEQKLSVASRTAEEMEAKMKVRQEDLEEKLRRMEKQLSSSQKSVLTENEKVEQQIASLKTEIEHAKKAEAASKAQVESAQTEVIQMKKSCDEQLDKMRVAMRQVQDKHLQDVIKFDQAKKQLDDLLKEGKDHASQLQKRVQDLEQALSDKERENAQLQASTQDQRDKWVKQYDGQYQVKIEEILKTHTAEMNELRAQLAEAKAAARDEAREAQEYKSNLARAAKEQHLKFENTIAKLEERLAQAQGKTDTLEQEKEDLAGQLKALETKRSRELSEFQSREQELERSLIATQHQATNSEATFARESTKLRDEAERLRKHVKTLEQEKMDLIRDCQKLNEEVSQFMTKCGQSEDSLKTMEFTNEKLRSELTRLKQELRVIETETEDRIESLQAEIDQHVQSRQEALSTVESLRVELKDSKKQAAEHITSFSQQAESLGEQVKILEAALQEKNQEIDSLNAEWTTERTELEQLRKKCNTLNDLHSSEMGEVIAQLEKKEEERNQLESSLENLRNKQHEMANEKDTLERKLKGLQGSVDRQAQLLRDAELSKQQLLDQLASEQENSNLLKNEILRRKEDYAELNKELATLRSEKHNLDRSARARENKLLSDLEQAKTSLQQAEQQSERAKQELKRAQEQIETLQASTEQRLEGYMEEVKARDEEKALAMQQLRQDLKEKETLLLDERNEAKRKQRLAQLELDRKTEDVQRLQAGLDAAQRNGIKALQELEEKSAAYDNLTADFENLGKSLQNLEKKLASVELAKEKLEQDLEKQNHALYEARNEMQDSESELRSKLRSEVEAHQASKRKLSVVEQEKEWLKNESEIKMSALQRQIQSLQSDLTRKDEDIENLHEKIRLTQEENARFSETANKTIASLKAETSQGHEQTKRELDEARETADQAARLCAQMEQERDTLQKRIQDLASELELLGTSHSDLKEEYQMVVTSQKELVAAKRKLESENKRLKMMTSAHTVASETSSESNVQQQLLAAEQEAYEAAKKEFQERLRWMEAEYEKEIQELKAATYTQPPASILSEKKTPEAFTKPFTSDHDAESKSSTGSSSHVQGSGRSSPDSASVEYFDFGPRVPPVADHVDASRPPLEEPGSKTQTSFSAQEELAFRKRFADLNVEFPKPEQVLFESKLGVSAPDASIMNTAKFLEARRNKATDESGDERRRTIASLDELKLPVPKGATPNSASAQGQNRRTLDSVEALRKETAQTKSTGALKTTNKSAPPSKKNKKSNNGTQQRFLPKVKKR